MKPEHGNKITNKIAKSSLNEIVRIKIELPPIISSVYKECDNAQVLKLSSIAGVVFSIFESLFYR